MMKQQQRAADPREMPGTVTARPPKRYWEARATGVLTQGKPHRMDGKRVGVGYRFFASKTLCPNTACADMLLSLPREVPERSSPQLPALRSLTHSPACLIGFRPSSSVVKRDKRRASFFPQAISTQFTRQVCDLLARDLATPFLVIP